MRFLWVLRPAFPLSVALRNGATTAEAVAVANGTINKQSFAYAGSAPVGVVSVGGAGKERQITNVAAGQLSGTSTDAVNGSQLFATNSAVDSLGSRVGNLEKGGPGSGNNKYVAVNSSSPTGASATGNEAIAVGSGAASSGEGSIALGNGAQSTAKGSVAIGSGSSDGGRGAESYTGKCSNAANNSVGTVSIGNAETGELRTVSNMADGVNGTDGVNLRQLDGAVAESKKYTDDSITKINNTVVNVDNRITKNEQNITSLQEGKAGLLQTSATKVDAPKPLGENSLTGGSGAIASAQNATALGNGSSTDRENSVSVGSAGAERQTTNLAGGTKDTDAANMAQVNAKADESLQFPE